MKQAIVKNRTSKPAHIKMSSYEVKNIGDTNVWVSEDGGKAYKLMPNESANIELNGQRHKKHSTLHSKK